MDNMERKNPFATSVKKTCNRKACKKKKSFIKL